MENEKSEKTAIYIHQILRSLIMKQKIALVVGATGLVGSNLVQTLLESEEYLKVIVWVRSTTGITHEKLEETIVDFNTLGHYQLNRGVDHIFCCLGTTIKVAKTKQNFKKVDLDYPVTLGRMASEKGVSQFIVISAMGANHKSRVFYNAVKGEMESELRKLSLLGLKIFRPSLLLGNRNDFRFGEKAAEVLSKVIPFVFSGELRKYKPIEGKVVAQAMYRVALHERAGVEVFPSDIIRQIGTNKK